MAQIDVDYEAAKTALTMNRDTYWCIACSNPRKRNYCPASSHSTRTHSIIPRNRLSLETQINLYLGRERYRGER